MTKTTKQLKTGNASAAKPGKVERFAITQDAADVAGQAGVDFAECELHAEAALAALSDVLAPLSGLKTEAAVEQWRHLRGAFVAGYALTMGCETESAGRAWTRAIAGINAARKADGMPELDKPQTVKALKAAADRAAKRKADEEANPKAGAGEEAAKAIKMELSSMEAHVIAMIRAGKWEMAAECIAGMASAAE